MQRYCIHDYDKILAAQIRLLNDSSLTAHNKKLVLDFYRYNFSKDISKPRLIRHLGSLRTAALFLKKDFEEATVRDFQDFIAHLKESNNAFATIDTHKEILKVFYKWLNNGKGCPECVAWFSSNKKKSRTLPESLLIQEDVKEMEQKTTNLRDKALISVLWESGARIGEIGSLQLKNVVFDEFGCKILIDGKTGMRRIRLVNCAPNLLEWINKHPNRNNPESCVFVNIEKGFAGPMHHRNLMAVLKKVAIRAGIKKPVNPHHFRHSRATYMAQFLTEAQLKEYFGWVQESKAAARYVHLSGKQVDDAILRMHGLKKPEYEANQAMFTVTFYGPGEKIFDLVKPSNELDLRELGLNERQVKALQLVFNEGMKMTNKKYRELFKVSKPTATRDLAELMEKRMLKEAGGGRSLYYLPQF